jgi:hypothetical protein
MICVLTVMDSVRNSVQKETESTYGAGGRAERVRERREMIGVNWNDKVMERMET